jgi:hypothetical protein
MEKTLKYIIPLILTLSLLGCQTPPADVAPSITPTATNTPAPTITPTFSPTPTDVPLEALPVDKIVQKYLAGEIDDVSSLSSEQHAALSAALAEKRNAEAGINFVSFTYLNDEEYFLNPKTLQPEKMPANPSDEFRQENSFTIYSEVKFDAQGNVMFPYNGEWRTVPNSAGFDFSMEITDPNHPIVTSIDMPKITEGEFAGMTPLQRNLIQEESGGPNTFRPGVTIKDGPGEIIFKSGEAFRIVPIFPLVTFETDNAGKEVLAKISLIMPSGVFSLYEEGEGTVVKATSRMEEYGDFWKSLKDNQIYYIAMSNDPKAKIGYASHISAENIQGISLGNTNSNDVSVVVASSFIKPKD